MDLQTWVSLFAVVASFGSLYVMLRRELAAFRAELKNDIAAARAESRADIEAARAESRADIETARAESRAGTESLAARMDRLDDRVYALAAGLGPPLGHAREAGGTEA